VSFVLFVVLSPLAGCSIQVSTAHDALDLQLTQWVMTTGGSVFPISLADHWKRLTV